MRNANLPADARSTARWFDAAAFGPPMAGSFGPAARGVIFGPGSEIVNLGIAKHFYAGERFRIRLELTATNAFNTPNYANPKYECHGAGAGGSVDVNRW